MLQYVFNMYEGIINYIFKDLVCLWLQNKILKNLVTKKIKKLPNKNHIAYILNIYNLFKKRILHRDKFANNNYQHLNIHNDNHTRQKEDGFFRKNGLSLSIAKVSAHVIDVVHY